MYFTSFIKWFYCVKLDNFRGASHVAHIFFSYILYIESLKDVAFFITPNHCNIII